MLTILLVIIYIAFISLGLPDSILGSAWPVMHNGLNVPVSYAGIVTIIVSCGTIISSLFSVKLIHKFGTGKVTTVSVFLTAAGLLGIYLYPNFIWICLMGIPLGLGAGAVDSGLNNFVALHYEARHMNWLHCFWGVGATTGPIIMAQFLKSNNWRRGYVTIGLIQIFLVICLVLSLPLWKKFEATKQQQNESEKNEATFAAIMSLCGVKPAFIGFFCYCSIELTTGLWGSSYLVACKGLSATQAASWVSFYYLGITVGRFL